DGADRDADAHAELHDGAEESVGPTHPVGWNLCVGERGHAGELHGSAGSVKEEDGDDEENGRSGTERRAEGHRCSGDGSVDDENAAEAEAAKDLDDEGLHAQVSAKEREQVE